MSLVITTFVPEGIVMASDSRQVITIETKSPDGKSLKKIETINSDNVYKTFLLPRFNKSIDPIFQVGVNSFGQDLLGGISTSSHIKRFVEEKLKDEDSVTTIPKKLVNFFRKDFPTADTGFHVVGYKKEDKKSIPYVYYCHVGKNIFNQRKNVKPDGSLNYGATWSGQIDVLAGILQPPSLTGPKGKALTMKKYPIIWGAMSLQDAVDFSIYAIRTTIDIIRFQARSKNVGGHIDVLVITPEGAKWIQRKELKGEY